MSNVTNHSLPSHPKINVKKFGIDFDGTLPRPSDNRLSIVFFKTSADFR